MSLDHPKVVVIVDARPQFIKCAAISRVLSVDFDEVLVHTGQHYDWNMSEAFFKDLDIPAPAYNLGVGSGSHGEQTARMLQAIEAVLLAEKPVGVVVYGDTNSTLAGALAASKLCMRTGHVEAGLRSFNRDMPEEINRVLTDHACELLFAPSRMAVQNLDREGLGSRTRWTGDVMYDVLLQSMPEAERRSRILPDLGLEPRSYYLATLHRPYTVDDPHMLEEVIRAFGQLDRPVVFPAHPRTRKMMDALAYSVGENLVLLDPVRYLDFLVLQKNARKILTDSGGIQKEAYFLGVPCVTLRPETEWVETVEAGWNVLVPTRRAQDIVDAVDRPAEGDPQRDAYGDGAASAKIASCMAEAWL